MAKSGGYGPYDDKGREMPEAWITQIRDAFKSEMQPLKASLDETRTMASDTSKQLASFVIETKTEMQTLHTRLLDVENAGKRSSDASTSDGWAPGYVELKGYCTFDERKTKGLTRAQALTIQQKLTECLHDSLRGAVRDIQLRGERSYSMRVFISPSVCEEVRSIWQEKVKANFLADVAIDGDWAGARVVSEPSPQRKTVQTTFGRVISIVRAAAIKKDYTYDAEWDPDWRIHVKKDGDAAELAVSFDPYDLTAKWSPFFIGFSELSEQQLNTRMKAAKF